MGWREWPRGKKLSFIGIFVGFGLIVLGAYLKYSSPPVIGDIFSLVGTTIGIISFLHYLISDKQAQMLNNQAAMLEMQKRMLERQDKMLDILDQLRGLLEQLLRRFPPS